MRHLLEFLNDYTYDQMILNEVCSMIAEEEIVNESFKSSIIQKLAQAIYNAEKTSNKKKSESAKNDSERYGYKKDPNLTTFASIFGPKTEGGRYNKKDGIQGLKWSEITDDDFKEYKADDKELIKLVKSTYGKKDKNADFIVMKDDKIINFIKAYGKDDKADGMFYFKSDEIVKYKGYEGTYTTPGGVKELTKPYYSYQTRPLKANEVVDTLKGLATIEGVKVYALEITDDMIKKYQDLHTDRKNSQEGIINYDKDSLEILRKHQVAKYKALAAEIRANKLQKDPNLLFNEITETNNQVIELYKKVMSSTEHMDERFELGRLMDYVSRAYESFYTAIRTKRQADKNDERYPDEKRWNFDRKRSQDEFNDTKEYVEKVKKMIKEIEDQL